MHAAIAVPGSASTILTHVFGRGLADERYVVERFRAMADGDIRRAPGEAAVPSIYYIGPPNDGSVFQNGQADCFPNAIPSPRKCVKGRKRVLDC